MTISLIVAVSENGVIGNELNEMPWEPIIEDLANFRNITSGNVVVMGSKTFESLNYRPLPNRINVVFTRRVKAEYPKKNVLYFANETDFLNAFDVIEDDIYIIGGSHIYKMFLPLADFMLITEIKKSYIGNIKFPKFDKQEWERSVLDSGEQGDVKFDFVEYFRKEL